MNTTKFEIAEYLHDEEIVHEYLNTVLEEGNAQEIVVALGHIAKAIGMTQIAERTGLSRPSLYKALSPNSKPQFDTILKVIRAIREKLQLKTSL
ncbi:probable addiction module antidote protein [Algoriphagus faecimaris]|uniref:Probable addiction module antidote protein n=1 Tax=Algoriphagus faecimaris TaxID=686796 RepID=A0A1G6TB69_9BACT|nr:addiction module antidote protein [Algoriphagus faecimaris]SDD25717.1 probable addiction module antidote protein [Algoriphagus faecimaris]